MTEVAAGSALPGTRSSGSRSAIRSPARTRAAMSVRSAPARRSAPSTLSEPAPCSSSPAWGSGCAVYCRMALTIGGVRPGLASSRAAAAPATTGAATDVPDSDISSWPAACSAPGTAASAGTRRARALRTGPVAPGWVDMAATMRLPGATRSGLIRLSKSWRLPSLSTSEPRVGPRELKFVTTSSPRSRVPLRLTAPTVMTEGSCPGELIEPQLRRPWLSVP